MENIYLIENKELLLHILLLPGNIYMLAFPNDLSVALFCSLSLLTTLRRTSIPTLDFSPTTQVFILSWIHQTPQQNYSTVISTEYIFGPKHGSLPSIQQKRKLYYFRNKTIKVDHPPLLMDNTTIPSVNNHKHLGLTLSEDAKWKGHITLTLNKAWESIGILRTLSLLLTDQV